MPSEPPPPHDTSPASWGWRVVAIVVLGVLLAGQIVFTLLGLLGFGLGGGSSLEIWLFVVVAVGVLLALLWLLMAVIRSSARPATALFGLVALLFDVGLAALILSGRLGPSCSDRELAIIAEVPPFAGDATTFEYESSSGACTSLLDVTATADEVLEHYRMELERDGWTVSVDDVPTESQEGGSTDTRELRASREGEVFTVALESWSGRTSAAIRVNG